MTAYRFISGIHAVRNVLGFGGDKINKIWIDKNKKSRRFRELINDISSVGLTPVKTTLEELNHLVPGVNHQGVVIQTRAPAALTEADIPHLLEQAVQPWSVLVLDNVLDPHNLGACLRTAEAAGVTFVIAPRDHSVGLTPTVSKVASGAAEKLPFIQVTNLARILKYLGDKYRFWIIGTSDKAENNLYQLKLEGNLCIVVGGEEKGIRRLTKERCDELVGLPMLGATESLNVSVAAGIVLYEVLRQRKYNI